MTKPFWDSWYKSARWRRRRAHQLLTHPLCVMCLHQGITKAATVADHIKPHKGDEYLFWCGELQSLCQSHHSSDKQRLEKSGNIKQTIGLDGWPV